jgi:periplasmic glucans biosynthesis protein
MRRRGLTDKQNRLSAVHVRKHLLLPFITVAIPVVATAQTWDREDVKFKTIEGLARELASKPYVPPNKEALPDWMKNLTYDQYRDIRFRPDQALWASENLPFRAMLFHPGYLYREPVILHEYTDTHQQNIRLTEAFFDYGSRVGPRGDLPGDAGFAGFRLHAPLNNPNYFDELVVFQGASYWRALGKGQRYGISSRGVAVDTGIEGTPEEFPCFREFWLEKPQPGDTRATVLALLDGASVTGAFRFYIEPGNDTVVNVRSVLYLRKPVKRLGLAPLSSMFWFGENSRRRFDDFRPEVHDSDGLLIRSGSGERIWRPVANDTGKLEFSSFSTDKCVGFGLLQRDRKFTSYEDAEASYHSRPSVWIEPTSDWGPGRVMLMEIPTANELSDNITAMWEPQHAPQVGDRISLNYKQHWTMKDDPGESGAYVVATRTGVHDWQPGQRTVIIEFTGPALEKLTPSDGVTAEIKTLGDNAGRIKVDSTIVQRFDGNRWRVAFQISSSDANTPLQNVGPVELRCALKKGEDYLSESWAYRITP